MEKRYIHFYHHLLIIHPPLPPISMLNLLKVFHLTSILNTDGGGEGDVICAIITKSRQDCRCAFWFKCISFFGPLHVLSLLSFFAIIIIIIIINLFGDEGQKIYYACLLYTSPSPRDKRQSRMPSSA